MREIGIRIALGAQPRPVLRLVVGRTVLLLLAGCSPGILALAAGQVLASIVYGVSPRDPALMTALWLTTILLGALSP